MLGGELAIAVGAVDRQGQWVVQEIVYVPGLLGGKQLAAWGTGDCTKLRSGDIVSPTRKGARVYRGSVLVQGPLGEELAAAMIAMDWAGRGDDGGLERFWMGGGHMLLIGHLEGELAVAVFALD